MKSLSLAAVLAAVLLAGCDRDPAAATPVAKAETQTKIVAAEMRDYTFAQRAEFRENMKTQIADINRDLDQLDAKVAAANEAARATAKPKLQALREQAAKLDAQLEAAKDATESTWGDVKTGFKKGMADVKEGFQQSRQWLSEKIAP